MVGNRRYKMVRTRYKVGSREGGVGNGNWSSRRCYRQGDTTHTPRLAVRPSGARKNGQNFLISAVRKAAGKRQGAVRGLLDTNFTNLYEVSVGIQGFSFSAREALRAVRPLARIGGRGSRCRPTLKLRGAGIANGNSEQHFLSRRASGGR
jgi:hypothetical protein